MKPVRASLLCAVLLSGVALATSSFAAGRGGGGHGGHGGYRGHGGYSHGGHGHSHVRLGVGFGFYGGWPYYGYPYYANPYPAYAYPAYPAYSYYPAYPGYPAEAPAYIEQGQPAPSAAAPAAGYWYYCNESQAYYPNVRECAGPWQKVPPQPPS